MDIFDLFENAGLSRYKSKALVAMIKCGEAKASEISDLSGIPSAKIYSVLDQLTDSGLVEKKPGRPIKYKV